MTAPHDVLLTPVDPPGPGLAAYLDGDDELAGGGDGWEQVTRPRRKAALEWLAEAAYTLTLPLLMDGMEHHGGDVSVEAGCGRLMSWLRPGPPAGRPPLLAVAGPVRQPSPATRWALSKVEWGEQVRGVDGQRIRQAVTVTLLEHTAAEILTGPAAAARARLGL